MSGLVRDFPVVKKLLLAVLALLTLSVGSADAQAKPWALIMGDSITYMSIPPLHAALDPTHNVYVEAWPGEGFGGGPWTEKAGYYWAHRYAQWFAALRPAVMVFALGTNDAIDSNITLGETANAIGSMFAMFPPATCTVAMGVRVNATHPGFDAGEAAVVNSMLRSVADVFVPVDFATVDGVHPRWPDGLLTFADLVRQGVAACP